MHSSLIRQSQPENHFQKHFNPQPKIKFKQAQFQFLNEIVLEGWKKTHRALYTAVELNGMAKLARMLSWWEKVKLGHGIMT